MVFIHGGSFQEGADFQTPGYFMAEKDVVFVSINYRLGILGKPNIICTIYFLLKTSQFTNMNTIQRKHNPNIKVIALASVKACIEYAILLTVYKAKKNGSAPEYISDLLKPQISTQSMTRRSTKQDLLVVPKHNLKTGGHHALSVHAPHL